MIILNAIQRTDPAYRGDLGPRVQNGLPIAGVRPARWTETNIKRTGPIRTLSIRNTITQVYTLA